MKLKVTRRRPIEARAGQGMQRTIVATGTIDGYALWRAFNVSDRPTQVEEMVSWQKTMRSSRASAPGAS